MKKSRLTEQQMVNMLREADRSSVATVAKAHGGERADPIQLAPAFRRDEQRRGSPAKQLGQENARVKKILAERDLEIEVMKEVTAKKW